MPQVRMIADLVGLEVNELVLEDCQSIKLCVLVTTVAIVYTRCMF